MVPRWRFLRRVFSASRVQHVLDLHPKFPLRPHDTMCGSMVDIESATAEIRQGKKQKKIEETTVQKYNGLPYYIGRP